MYVIRRRALIGTNRLHHDLRRTHPFCPTALTPVRVFPVMHTGRSAPAQLSGLTIYPGCNPVQLKCPAVPPPFATRYLTQGYPAYFAQRASHIMPAVRRIATYNHIKFRVTKRQILRIPLLGSKMMIAMCICRFTSGHRHPFRQIVCDDFLNILRRNKTGVACPTTYIQYSCLRRLTQPVSQP